MIDNNKIFTIEERNKVKSRSAFMLPDKPSSNGLTAAQIKRALYEPLLYIFDILRDYEIKLSEENKKKAEILQKILDGELVVKRAEQDSEGNIIHQTYATIGSETGGSSSGGNSIVYNIMDVEVEGDTIVLTSIDSPLIPDNGTNNVDLTNYFTKLEVSQYVYNNSLSKFYITANDNIEKNIVYDILTTKHIGVYLYNDKYLCTRYNYDTNQDIVIIEDILTNIVYKTKPINLILPISIDTIEFTEIYSLLTNKGGNINGDLHISSFADENFNTSMDITPYGINMNTPSLKYNDIEVATLEDIEMLQAKVDELPVLSKEISSTTNKVTIPNNALDYCLIEEIGGMSYESENLIVLADVEETTKNGVTYSVKDGVITIVGQTGEDSLFVSPRLKNKIYLDGTYSINYFITKKSGDIEYCRCESSSGDLLFVSNNVSQSKKTATLTNTNMVKLVILIQENKVVDLEIKPMLVKKDVIPTTYKQGYDNFKHTKVTDVKFEQNNLLKPQYIVGADSDGNLIRDNFSLIIDDEGWYTFNKNSNSSATLSFLNTLTSSKPETYNKPLPIGTYSFRVVFKEGKFNDLGTFKINYDTTTSTDNSIIIMSPSSTLGYRAIGFYSNQPITRVYLYSRSSLVVNNAKFKVELVKNDFISDNIEIPTEVQNLDGYGLGIDNENYNYIEYNENDDKYYYTKNIASYTFTGNESISQQGTAQSGVYRYAYYSIFNVIKCPTSADEKGIIKLNNLETNSVNYSFITKGDCIAVDTKGNIFFYVSSIQTLEDMKNYLKGKTLLYKLAEPITIDVSDIINEKLYLQVQEKGTITFENENKKDVPNKITYAIKVV